MPTKPLTQRTLFSMGREKLEKRILKFYADSQDSDSVTQYVVAVLVRQSLCINDFSLLCQNLIKDILLSAEPTDVLRKYAPLFRDFFASGKEWEQVIRRLYKNTKEYHRYNNRVSECKKYLFVKTTPIEELGGQQYKLVSTFEDAVGKVHTWSLRDADKNSSATKIDAVLELLSSLTIFEKDDVRRFVKLENSEIVNCTRYIKIRKGEIVEESAGISASQNESEPTVKPSLAAGFDFSAMSEEEKLELVKLLLPEEIQLTTRMERAEAGALEEASDDGAKKVFKRSIAAPQENVSINGTVTSADEETPAIASKSAKKPSDEKHEPSRKKSKSEKQKERVYKDELLKEATKGKPKKKKNNRRRKR